MCAKRMLLTKKIERPHAFDRADATGCTLRSCHRKEVVAFAGRCRGLALAHPNKGLREAFGGRADMLVRIFDGADEDEDLGDSEESPSRGRLATEPASA